LCAHTDRTTTLPARAVDFDITVGCVQYCPSATIMAGKAVETCGVIGVYVAVAGEKANGVVGDDVIITGT
jgi:hypothetical protein